MSLAEREDAGIAERLAGLPASEAVTFHLSVFLFEVNFSQMARWGTAIAADRFLSALLAVGCRGLLKIPRRVPSSRFMRRSL
jgi:hypothetical protein